MNKKNGKRSSLIILVLLLLVGLTSAYVASTYAKYTEELADKDGEAIIAKWSFVEDNASSNFDVDLTETIPAAKLTADRIAPGTAGTFTIELKNDNTETGIDVSIVLGEVTNAPANIVFISDNQPLPANRTFTRHLDAVGSNGTTSQTLVINWYWPYEDNDNLAAQDLADTTLGKAGGADGNKLTIPVTITGTQTEPTP